MDHELYTAALPSYETATERNPWSLIVPYLRAADLISLARTCSKLRHDAESYLWAEPRRFFPHDEADACNAFLRFLSALKVTPAHIHHHPGHSTFHLDLSGLNVPHGTDLEIPKDWLWRLSQPSLLNLRSIIIDNFEALDAGSTTSILGRHNLPVHGHQNPALFPSVRFLTITRCPNVDSYALRALLKQVPDLYYLDVSSNRFPIVGPLPRKLRVLKHSHSSFSGASSSHFWLYFADVVSSAPVRSLDLRRTPLQDVFAFEYMSGIVESDAGLTTQDLPPPYHATDPITRPSWAQHASEWANLPNLLARPYSAPDDNMSTSLNFSDDATTVLAQLQEPSFLASLPPLGPAPFSSDPTSHLTHLRISGTRMTARAAGAFLRIFPLEVLDLGSMPLTAEPDDLARIGSDLSATARYLHDPYALGAAVILHALRSARGKLRWLRVGHHVVSGYAALFDGARLPKGTPASEVSLDQWSKLEQGASVLADFFGPNEEPMRGTLWDPAALPGKDAGSTAESEDQLPKYVFEPALLAIPTLTLTNVPSRSPGGHLTRCLKALLGACADVERVAREISATDGGVEEIFLEMEPATATNRHHAERRESMDWELMEEGGREDFSFFPDETTSTRPQRVTTENSSQSADADVVQTLKKFRQEERDNGRAWGGSLAVVVPSTRSAG